MSPDPDPVVDKLNEVILAVAKVETKLSAIADNNTILVTTMTNYINANDAAKRAVAENKKWFIGLTASSSVGVAGLILTIIFHMIH